ncbi:hypothetical protein V1289_004855 [Bradyrhizobium sp. AZCC 2289]
MSGLVIAFMLLDGGMKLVPLSATAPTLLVTWDGRRGW